VLFLHVSNGVTTVRYMAGDPWHIDLRRRIRAGEVVGPGGDSAPWRRTCAPTWSCSMPIRWPMSATCGACRSASQARLLFLRVDDKSNRA
jgi:hypothetical protein